MLEGRPPFRDRGRVAATLKGVDRLPLRPPMRCGPLTQVVTGLLRKEARSGRTGRWSGRCSPGCCATTPAVSTRRARGRRSGRAWRRAGRARRSVLAGTALAVVAVTAAAVAVARGLPGDDRAAGTPPVSATASGGTASPAPAPTGAPSPAPSGAASPGPSRTAAPSAPGTGALPAGYRTYRAPEGFSVALPAGWERQDTSRATRLSYRVTFGADDDPRTLAVTYSERVGPDPVAVWRDTVEPGLVGTGSYRRIGVIRPTTYQGREAADMEWLAADDGTRVRTFGRGFLLGEGRGFSLRWTTPAADWTRPGSREALRTVLRTFRPGSA